ncbi:glycosyltransferase [Bacteroides intestinalis]|jgi:teichuronic acid biosynthesis glycosyltransferase TuaC|nr:glycosyltransferase [Bacteroides intestinalis]
MKVLIVANKNSGSFSSFVIEQGSSIAYEGAEVEYFGVIGKGWTGYLSCRKKLIKKIEECKPDLIHAHYGLCGLLANLQRKVPVVTTFHGSDIQSSTMIRCLSRLAMYLSKYNIFVLKSMPDRVGYKKKNYSVVPCGVNLSVFKPMDMVEARKRLNWNTKDIYVLFAGRFDNPVKNPLWAKKCIALAGNCKLIELKGYKRIEVNLLMNACNLLLVTSISEASPQVVKEAMACNHPIVSTDVGDVRSVFGETKGCYITSRNEVDCVEQIRKAIRFSMKYSQTDGRGRVIDLGLDIHEIAQKIISLYKQL